MPEPPYYTVTIRPARSDDAAGIARVHVESWRTTYRGIVPDSVLDRLDVAQRQDYWRREMVDSTSDVFVYVAADAGGDVAGFVSGGRERSGEYPGYTGEIYAIYLQAEWQGYGIGRDLLRTGVRTLLDLGHRSILIWALTENPFCGFYRRMGGEVIGTQEVTIGQKTLEETAFGWKNIAMVLDDSAEGTRDGDDQ